MPFPGRYTGADNLQLIRVSTYRHVYTDAGCITDAELHSQIGYVVFLRNGQNHRACVQWTTIKSRGIMRSTFGAELFALLAGVHRALFAQGEVHNVLHQHTSNRPPRSFLLLPAVQDLMVGT